MEVISVAESVLKSLRQPIFVSRVIDSQEVPAGEAVAYTDTIPERVGFTAHVTSMHIADTDNTAYGQVQIVWVQDGNRLNAHVINTGSANVAPAPRYEVLYIPT